jgi:hypothetical protein
VAFDLSVKIGAIEIRSVCLVELCQRSLRFILQLRGNWARFRRLLQRGLLLLSLAVVLDHHAREAQHVLVLRLGARDLGLLDLAAVQAIRDGCDLPVRERTCELGRRGRGHGRAGLRGWR